jgi:DNA replication protein DnaC
VIKDCPYRNNCNGIDCNKEFCMKKYRLDTLYEASLLSPIQREYKKLHTDADGTDVNEFTKSAQLERVVDKFVQQGSNLYLHSYTCGNGKTSWAIRFVNSYINKIWSKSNLECQALFISVPRYLLALKENISGYSEYATFINKNVLTADLVVWDDIAAKSGSEFELNHLLNAINTRMDAGKSNIFTSNLGKRELTNALGERLASRICNKSIDIELQGADKRYLGLISAEDHN